MSSPFFGLSIAARALAAQQQALNTVAHNTANANTPGYSRQTTVLETTAPYALPTANQFQHNGQLGTGVEASLTRRMRDTFIDGQVRNETLSLGHAEVQRDALHQVEAIYNEPSDTGLQELMSRFWAAWQELSNEPSNTAQRANLREQARTLVTALNSTYTKLTDLQTDLDTQVQMKVTEVNSIADRIAALNIEIARVEAGDSQANDLRDKRDLLLDDLHRLLPVSTVEDGNGQLHIFFQGRQLVAADQTFTLEAKNNPANGGHYDLTFDGGATFLSATSGQLGGLQGVRDGVLNDQISRLDDLANGLRDAVNTAHQAGYGLDGLTGRDFFDSASTGAGDLALSADVEASLDSIAAAGNGEGTAGAATALAIAALQNTAVSVGSVNEVLGEYYRSFISELGVASRAAADKAANQEVLLHHLEGQRQEVAGVSLDEEAIQMIQYQRAYQAAARVVTVTDEMLDTLINRMGVVGR